MNHRNEEADLVQRRHPPCEVSAKSSVPTWLVAAVTSTVMLAGCGSAPKPLIPSGASRTPVNSEATIRSYTARTAEEQASDRERSVLSRQVQDLNAQVASLKAHVVMLSMEAAQNRAKVPPLAQRIQRIERVEPATSRPSPVSQVSAGETVEAKSQAVVFRVMHRFGGTGFNASPSLKEDLLLAAKESGRIEIRGRTDAQHDNAVDRDIALQRAARARDFLIGNGIPPDKIVMSSLASGGHAADNATEAGKALNRRVEIEAFDLDDSVIAGMKAIPKGSPQ